MLLIPAASNVGSINSVCVSGLGPRNQLHLTLQPSAPEGLGEIIHMGHEMSNLQGDLQRLQASKDARH